MSGKSEAAREDAVRKNEERSQGGASDKTTRGDVPVISEANHRISVEIRELKRVIRDVATYALRRLNEESVRPKINFLAATQIYPRTRSIPKYALDIDEGYTKG